MNHCLHVVPWMRRVGDRLLIRDWLALTIGRHTISWRELDEVEVRHELMHVYQWADGWFVPRYIAASLAAVKNGGHWYWDNAYEVEARTFAWDLPWEELT